MKIEKEGAMIVRKTILAMQICAPKDWTIDQFESFAESQNPAGTINGWCVAVDGDSVLGGSAACGDCQDREGYVHRVVVV